jgi:hypothetical protein
LVAELEAIGTDPEKFGAFLSRVALKKERERLVLRSRPAL